MTFSRGSGRRREGGRFGGDKGRGFQNSEQDKKDKEEGQVRGSGDARWIGMQLKEFVQEVHRELDALRG